MGRANLIALTASLLSIVARPAMADELKLLTPGAVLSSLKELVPAFEQSSGHRVQVTLSPALAVADRVKNDEAFDIVITGKGSADALEKLSKLTAGSTTVIARVGVGVFVRRGDPKPDVSSADAFKRALMNAKVIVYSDPALGGSASNYVHELIAKLDTTGEIKPKIKLAVEYRSIANTVAAGGVDLALNQVAEIVADARLELVGPLPAPYQRYTNYAAGVITTSRSQDASRQFIAFMATPEAAAIMRRRGFEPN
jgi:molybdate transport system substrate-binding protein